ncbi:MULTISPECIES: phosphopantetheine-binding protein [unclassified Streptomyces]|uniref:phosphopantetheine-binding protein n=1 Tax=unclassified Streptomyces TaxID=2593676 RepID=UPI0006AF16EC|nr:phosphopantetheine-binding protein [Streptomyces sp. NRRL WC-3618]
MTDDSEFSNSMDTLVLENVRSLTGNADVGLDDDFFDVGGNSIIAIRLAQTLSEELGIRRDVRIVFKNRVLRDISEALRARCEGVGSGQAP